MKRALKGFGASLVNPKYTPLAFRVAIVVGSILFLINHGTTLLQGKMTRQRWISAAITYFVPYMVNIHGQYMSSIKYKSRQS